ncbi:hypothetical protein LHJ74_32285 [Streptomyces sp. N2-109]|uniref:Integral membrane protein n=1 Tax=Streptomyces gossypii TaxID=2883101 RepID=A0ABT2K4V5_9ACTN|nr:hypothetical protein [Streptomyces gossypii]MCT2594535.1 hypothetical protein [Streptomyces gossypii]
MSYPPDPPQQPYGPYGGPQYGAGPYGGGQPQQQPAPPAYGQQPPYAQPQQNPQPYGYAQQAGYGMQPYPGGMQPYPGGMPWMPMRMPGQLTTARVLLFVAGAVWSLMAVGMLIGALAAQDSDDLMFARNSGDAVVAIGFAFFVIGGGMAALHFTAASLFGRGGPGTRTMALVASSLNTVIASYGLIQYAGNETTLESPAILVLWLGVAVLTLVFCSLNQAAAWFNRPRY